MFKDMGPTDFGCISLCQVDFGVTRRLFSLSLTPMILIDGSSVHTRRLQSVPNACSFATL